MTVSTDPQPETTDSCSENGLKDTVDSSEGIDGTAFYINVVFPNSDSCKVQVSTCEIVQEIHRALVEREESCHRTCFSLQFNGQTLDLFTDLKSIEGLGEGSEIRVLEGINLILSFTKF